VIERFEYPKEALRAGGVYYVVAVGAEPIAVEIRCFVRRPPPPGYKPCAECGSFVVRSGEALQLFASEATFQAEGGSLELRVRDADGDSRHVRLTVVGRDRTWTPVRDNA
jgi:hypothetical protein